jgi:hypothetical protein
MHRGGGNWKSRRRFRCRLNTGIKPSSGGEPVRSLHHCVALAVVVVVAAGLCAAPAPAADKFKTLKGITTFGRVALDCRMSNSRVYVGNSTQQTIPAGRPMGWRTAGGQEGAFTLPYPFDPGKVIGVGQGDGASCTAWTTLPLPTLQVSP